MLHGAFGPVHPFHVAGWARDSDHGSAAVEIEVRLDGRTVGTTSTGGGAGHGFSLATRQPLPIYEIDRLQVIARGPGGDVVRLDHAVPPRAALRYPHPASDATQHPVFILGAVRSGTTAVMQALSSQTRFVGPGEGHLLDLSMHLYMLVQKIYAERRPVWEAGLHTLITAVPESFLLDAVRHCFVELAKARFPSGHWLDRTPTSEMIVAAPLLKAIWPHARFIFLKRRGIENVQSQLRRFAGTDFEGACRTWADSMASWTVVRERLGGSAIEIEHLDLARHPGQAADGIGRLLSLTGPELSRVRQALASVKPERSTDSFADVSCMASTGWTTGQVDVFREVCGGAMRGFGYSEDRSYHAQPGRPPATG